MLHSRHIQPLVVAALLAVTACQPEAGERPGERVEEYMAAYDQVEARMQKYALTPMEMDLSGFGESEQQLIRELLTAAELADEIFWRQTSHAALPMRGEIEASLHEDDPVRMFYMAQAGPYDRLDHDAPFLENVSPRSPGGAFYPEDLTADEFQAWVDQHPEDREAFLSPYTVIRRDGEGLVAVPYHEEYADLVEPLAMALRRAADLSENESFARYLRAKADGVLSDEYFDADTAWIKMAGSKFDITIGPFEVYSDELMSIKASYEASVEIVDQEESAKLEIYKRNLAELEANLPYEDRYKVEGAGLTAEFTIVRDIYRGGDLRVGYQPVAANLPNDPRVATEVGNKKTFWKNFFEARLDRVILPISQVLVAEDQVQYVTPQGFFDMVLLHELAHGLGPRYAETPEGRVPVNQALTTNYSWIEEAKATVAGLESLRYLIELGVTDAGLLREYYTSYLGSIFRTIRFGTGEAHGQATLVEFNFFFQNGSIVYDEDSHRFAVDYDLLPGQITELAEELLMIEATGDFDRAEALKQDYGRMPRELRSALKLVTDVPVDPVAAYGNRW
jgi:hypothetical protein